MEKIFAVGDIHGCYDKLMALMKKIPFQAGSDRLVFLGDYIDRGNQSREVVDYLVQLKEQQPQTIFLEGNHEQMLLDYLDGDSLKSFLMNGGQKTLNSYMGHQWTMAPRDPKILFPSDHLEFFNTLAPYFEEQDYIFVHAGMRDGMTILEQDLQDLLWIREDFYFSKFDFGKKIVFGHTPFPEPFIFNNRIGIDTGAVYGNRLSALELPAMKFYSV